jgi:hypothetical protein
MDPSGWSSVNGPTHEPARVLSFANASLASIGEETSSEGRAVGCATAVPEADIASRKSARVRCFMMVLLGVFSFGG